MPRLRIRARRSPRGGHAVAAGVQAAENASGDWYPRPRRSPNCSSSAVSIASACSRISRAIRS